MRRDVAGVRRVASGERHASVQREEKAQESGGSGVEGSDAAEEFSLCEKPLAVAVRAQADARGRAAGRLW